MEVIRILQDYTYKIEFPSDLYESWDVYISFTNCISENQEQKNILRICLLKHFKYI